MPIRTARRSINTAGPAVPDESRFDSNATLVRKGERTGAVVLSGKTGWSTWSEYFDLRDASARVPDDFMADRPLNVRI
jgi:hypothetical protein